MRKIYLAGPDVFRSKPDEQHFNALREILKRNDFEGRSPFDSDASITKQDFPPDKAAKIYLANRTLIDQCDAVLANISPFRGPSCDPGTAWEIGYAVAKNKPVFAYVLDHESFRPHSTYLHRCQGMEAAGLKVKTDTFPVIEDFGLPDNLMISCSVHSTSASEIAAVMAMVRFFREIDGKQ